MIIIRPIAKKDIDALIKIAFTAHIGMTSLPKNPDLLEKKILASEEAFRKDVAYPLNENYLFVLEDLSSFSVGGVCGISSKTGINRPKYFFKISTERIHNERVSSLKEVPFMHLVKYANAPSEICSLYLLPEFRREGLGRLLSLSRFLFIAAYPHRFDHTIYAEMRSFVDKNQNCPFWDGIGRHFLDINYDELLDFRDSDHLDIQEILPKHPIYIPLLPTEVQDVIGKIHTNTWPAYNMLRQEGFAQTDEFDVFDAGPKIEAVVKNIRTIKFSIEDTVIEIIRHPIESPRYLLSNQRLDFLCCISFLQKTHTGVSIPIETAEALQLKIGDRIRYITVAADPPPHFFKETP